MTTELRILTVRQPWAWAIIHGGKDVENRPRNIAGDYRGPVAVHAGLSFDMSRAGDFSVTHPMGAAMTRWFTRPGPLSHESGPWTQNRGAIIGVVDLVDVHHALDREQCIRITRGASYDGIAMPCSAWAEPGAHHMVLANPRPLAVPISFRGALGLRRLDQETTAAVWSQIGA